MSIWIRRRRSDGHVWSWAHSREGLSESPFPDEDEIVQLREEESMQKSTRFDYIAYDEISAAAQARCKAACIELESAILQIGECGEIGRQAARALSYLEDVYAACGRAIRDVQLARETVVKPQEERGAA